MKFLGFGWRKEQLRARFYPADFRGMYRRFEDAIRELSEGAALVLDAGCGSGRVFRYETAAGARVVGVDVTSELRGNPNIGDGVRGDVTSLPFRDAAFDLVLSSHMIEHLREPERAFREMARVLRGGGRLLLLTPNRFHYVPLVASMLPQRLHVKINRSRGVDAQDVFPTLYRANTPGKLRRLLEGAGLTVERLERFETEPEYLAFHPLAYAVGVGYERLVNRFGFLAALRVNLVAVARKD
ncbi:MAG: class I SAM-dependent methyltransferase [Dehalococcoidia bacterium]|nr:class I SAM-dependent methyltransferase [Dehalococcoidia bacterium]